MSQDNEELTRRSEEWAAIRNEIAASAGFAANSRIRALIRGFGILAGNQRELVRLLSALDAPESLPIWDYEHPERLEAALDELTRLVHNFVASAVSLIDHTRNIIKGNYDEDDPVRGEYHRRVAESFVQPFPQFVKDLRNYTLHNRLPVSSAHMSWSADNPTPGSLGVTILLHPSDLLESHRWSGDARSYLTSLSEDIVLRAVAEDYLALVSQFHEWLVNALQDKHAGDVAQTNELIEKEHRFLGRS